MKTKRVSLQDGDNLMVIVDTQGPSVFDVTDEFAGAARMYRAVSTISGPLLELVPLATPVRVRHSELNHLKDAARTNEIND